ncbi:hypothetical protein NDU88_008141 [Pleurodeles waltl]|uniref:Uncharacterized protein n=1 Tax=Pleurodeles waltl TaxID=8319 RepID=A0AAV7NZY2_PLEWA|nr:hypothetical protein NDU88_008141 [Pleurodeles waltl]
MEALEGFLCMTPVNGCLGAPGFSSRAARTQLAVDWIPTMGRDPKRSPLPGRKCNVELSRSPDDPVMDMLLGQRLL